VHFHLEQPLPASPTEAIDVLVDPGYLASLTELPRLGRPEVLDRVDDGEQVRLRVRHRFTGSLSPAVTRVVDPAKLVWVEETTYDRAAATATMRVRPEHYADRLRAWASFRFLPSGPASCTRVADGEVAVRFPLVGGKVERAIVSGLEDHLTREADLVARWLRRASS
jgi:hypothetical protein